jgi:hypothetical protein
MSAVDTGRRRAALWRRPAAGMAHDVAASSHQWAETLARMDRSRRLTLEETNRLLDTIVVTQDTERELAARVLQRRLEQHRKRGGR